jgi:hypothetical protein
MLSAGHPWDYKKLSCFDDIDRIGLAILKDKGGSGRLVFLFYLKIQSLIIWLYASNYNNQPRKSYRIRHYTALCLKILQRTFYSIQNCATYLFDILNYNY